MRVITVLLITVVGLACCAISTAETNQEQHPVCKTTLDLLRNDENVLNIIKYDEQFSSEFIGLLESNVSSENLCGLLAVHQTGNEFFIAHVVRAIGAIVKVASSTARVAGSVARAAGSVARAAGSTARAASSVARAGARAAKTVSRAVSKTVSRANEIAKSVSKAANEACKLHSAIQNVKNDRKTRKRNHY